MRQMLSLVRRCAEDYNMIEENDRIAVGLSGGKDSIATLAVLKKLSEFYPKTFSVIAITLDMGFEGADFTPLEELCASLDTAFHLVRTNISQVVFDIRKETSPCSLCANMRRGALYNEAKRLGCTKTALGHHMDDAVETFMLSLMFEGRINCFSPVSYLDRTDMTVVRPLLYAGEKEVRDFVRREGYPVQKSLCPADGYTKRQEMKDLLAGLSEARPNTNTQIFSAMQRSGLKGWEACKREK